jgi:DNA polymerase III delta prime subunit
MVDPATFRRINANYPLSYIKQDELGEDDSDEDTDDCGCGSDSEKESGDEKPKGKLVMWKDKMGKKHLIHIAPGDEGPDITSQKLDAVEDESDEVKHVFTEEELLIASPVVLGFSFSDKVWLEFSLSGIKEIEWNDEAFDSLVLQQHIKNNLKGLVSSHRFNAAKTIDDVIVGKGKGLNVVLHGPPGVGKTLTGESIAEYLRCPLYAVSSGELGTNAAQLERDLNRIMDITHSWGAILLLDEADVFLEARQPHDIHRNALVSVFLRLTEYYQGILFLTTNRVATFDEAFQSRIHMGIRYDNLTTKARKKIWQHYVGKVFAMAGGDEEHKCGSFTEADYEELSKKVMNGRQVSGSSLCWVWGAMRAVAVAVCCMRSRASRSPSRVSVPEHIYADNFQQIKNAVKTSQAIAVSEKGVFGMQYIKRVMDVHESFEEDMKGGLGYRDAMRQYT